MSLLTFDEDATNINIRAMTPRSAEVLRNHGVQPNELLRRPLGFFAALPEFRGKSLEALKVAAEMYEHNRQATLAEVKSAYENLILNEQQQQNQKQQQAYAAYTQMQQQQEALQGLPASARKLSPRAQRILIRERNALLRKEEQVANQLREKLVERMVDDQRRKLCMAMKKELETVESQLRAQLDAFFWRATSNEGLTSEELADRTEITIFSGSSNDGKRNGKSVSDATDSPSLSSVTSESKSPSMTLDNIGCPLTSARGINFAKLIVQQLPKITGLRLSVQKPLANSATSATQEDDQSLTVGTTSSASRVLVEVTSHVENPKVMDIVASLRSTAPALGSSRSQSPLSSSRERNRDRDVDDMLVEHRRQCEMLIRDCITRLKQHYTDEQKRQRREAARIAQIKREALQLEKNAELEAREKERAQRIQRNVEMHARALEAQQRMARERTETMRARIEQTSELQRIIIEERAREAEQRRFIQEAKKKELGTETLRRQQIRMERTKRLQEMRQQELEKLRRKEIARQEQYLARCERQKIEKQKLEERVQRLAELTRQRIEEMKLEQEERARGRARRLEMRLQKSEAHRAITSELKAQQNEIRTAAKIMHQALLKQAHDRRRQADEYNRLKLRKEIESEYDKAQQLEIEERQISLEKAKLNTRVSERIRQLKNRVEKLCKSDAVGELVPISEATAMSIVPKSLKSLEERAQVTARVRRRELEQIEFEEARARSRSRVRERHNEAGGPDGLRSSRDTTNEGSTSFSTNSAYESASYPSAMNDESSPNLSHRRSHRFGQSVNSWDASLSTDQIYSEFVQPIHSDALFGKPRDVHTLHK